MLKDIFHDSLKISKFARMKNHSSVTGWQKLFFSYKSFKFSAAVVIAISLLLRYMAENLQVT